MEEDIDRLVEDIETLSTEINQINFKIDGATEELQELEDKRPFLVRQIDVNKRKLRKLSTTLLRHMQLKQDLDTRLGAYQVAKAAETNPNVNTNIPEKPKE